MTLCERAGVHDEDTAGGVRCSGSLGHGGSGAGADGGSARADHVRRGHPVRRRERHRRGEQRHRRAHDHVPGHGSLAILEVSSPVGSNTPPEGTDLARSRSTCCSSIRRACDRAPGRQPAVADQCGEPAQPQPDRRDSARGSHRGGGCRQLGRRRRRAESVGQPDSRARVLDHRRRWRAVARAGADLDPESGAVRAPEPRPDGSAPTGTRCAPARPSSPRWRATGFARPCTSSARPRTSFRACSPRKCCRRRVERRSPRRPPH